jgi:hypothetical protein
VRFWSYQFVRTNCFGTGLAAIADRVVAALRVPLRVRAPALRSRHLPSSKALALTEKTIPPNGGRGGDAAPSALVE